MLVNTIVGRLLALLVTSLARAQSITVNVAENILSPTTTSLCPSGVAACSSCAFAQINEAACRSAIPNLKDISNTDLAECLCYNPVPSPGAGFVWVPNHYDPLIRGCVDWYKTWTVSGANAAASNYADMVGFCNFVGNVLSATSTDMGTINLATITQSAVISNLAVSEITVTGVQTEIAPAPSESVSGAAHRGSSVKDRVTWAMLGAGAAGILAAALAL